MMATASASVASAARAQPSRSSRKQAGRRAIRVYATSDDDSKVETKEKFTNAGAFKALDTLGADAAQIRSPVWRRRRRRVVVVVRPFRDAFGVRSRRSRRPARRVHRRRRRPRLASPQKRRRQVAEPVRQGPAIGVARARVDARGFAAVHASAAPRLVQGAGGVVVAGDDGDLRPGRGERAARAQGVDRGPGSAPRAFTRAGRRRSAVDPPRGRCSSSTTPTAATRSCRGTGASTGGAVHSRARRRRVQAVRVPAPGPAQGWRVLSVGTLWSFSLHFWKFGNCLFRDAAGKKERLRLDDERGQ